jgi:EAL domain-containing protein (putative c-di-GMP-specific phosphodiesterase class I)
MQLMGDALGVATVAEGVETAEELALVMTIGCTYVQGFLIGRPVAAADVDHGRRPHMDDELLARRAAGRRDA